MQKNFKIDNPMSVFPETLMTLYVDKSQPLTLTLQLFWFDEIISEFMNKVKTYSTKSGVIIMLSHHFTYVPVKMERKEITYLHGFHSNSDGDNYSPIEIKCDSEEEKVKRALQVSNALQELVMASAREARIPTRSLRIDVGLDRAVE